MGTGGPWPRRCVVVNVEIGREGGAAGQPSTGGPSGRKSRIEPIIVARTWPSGLPVRTPARFPRRRRRGLLRGGAGFFHPQQVIGRIHRDGPGQLPAETGANPERRAFINHDDGLDLAEAGPAHGILGYRGPVAVPLRVIPSAVQGQTGHILPTARDHPPPEIRDRFQPRPLQKPLDGDLQLLSGAGMRNSGHEDNLVGQVSDGEVLTDGSCDRLFGHVRIGAVGQVDEQRHVVVSAQFRTDNQGLGDFRQRFDHRVDVCRTEPQPVAVEGRVGTAVDEDAPGVNSM